MAVTVMSGLLDANQSWAEPVRHPKHATAENSVCNAYIQMKTRRALYRFKRNHLLCLPDSAIAARQTQKARFQRIFTVASAR
jgi:hypothetical protein